MEAKQQRDGKPVPANPVLVLMVSLFIIMLSFFILLNNLGVPDKKRQRSAIGSLNENFGVLSGGSSLFESPGSQAGGGKLSKIASLLDFSDLVKNAADQPIMITEAGKTTVVLAGGMLFEPGSAQIKVSAYPVLKRLAHAAVEMTSSVEIAGYMGKGGGGMDQAPSPRELSALRALSVLKYFTEKEGVSPKLLTAYGWGDYKPAVSEKIPESRTVNERMEFTFSYAKELERPEGAFTFKNFFFRVLDQR